MPDEPAPITQMVGSEVIRPRYLKVTPASRFSWDESQLRLGRGWVRAAAAHKCDLEPHSAVKSAEMRPWDAFLRPRRPMGARERKNAPRPRLLPGPPLTFNRAATDAS